MQRRMAGETHWREPIPTIFHRDEGVWAVSVRASTLAAFRKRFSEEDLAAIPEASIPKPEAKEKTDPDDGDDLPNSGTLVLDAVYKSAEKFV